MYFGNDAINNANKAKSLELVEVVFEVPDKSVLEGTILEEAVFSEEVNGYIYMKNNLKVLVQDYHTAAQGNEIAPHNCRVKIMEPKDCRGIEIKIDKNGNTSFLEKKKDDRPYKPDIKKKIKPAVEFADKNGKELFTIWNNWKDEDKQLELLDKVMEDETTYKTADFSTSDSNEKIYYPKLKEEEEENDDKLRKDSPNSKK